MSVPEEETQELGVKAAGGAGDGGQEGYPVAYVLDVVRVCVCLLLVRARAKIKGNKYGATRSAGDYRRKVQLARLCAWGGEDMV